MTERPDGYYWVRSTSGNQPPYVRFANKSTVLVQGYEIGPPCSRDDAKQPPPGSPYAARASRDAGG